METLSKPSPTTVVFKSAAARSGPRTPLCKLNKKCTYRISKPAENEYLIIKNIMENLLSFHWNITLDYVNFYLDNNLKACDQNIEIIGVDQVIARDFRHPNALFKNLSDASTNKTVKDQYESEWFERYKLIKPKLQSKTYYTFCNTIGLKIHFLMYLYGEKEARSVKCSSEKNEEALVALLLDFYISQTFMKNCYGNLEMLARSIRKLLKHDCERAHSFKTAYFNSKYLNLFRTCDPNLSVYDLTQNRPVSKCTNKFLNGTINKKYCAWYEIVCKQPNKCLKKFFNSSDILD
jgi:hypothetical protein